MAKFSTTPPIIGDRPTVRKAGGSVKPSGTPLRRAPWMGPGQDILSEPTDGTDARARTRRGKRGNRERGAFLTFVIATRDGEERDNAVLAENEKFEIKTGRGTAELSMTLLKMEPSCSKLEICIKGRHGTGTDSEEGSAASQGDIIKKAAMALVRSISRLFCASPVSASKKDVVLERSKPVKIRTGPAQSFVEITYEGFRPRETG